MRRIATWNVIGKFEADKIHNDITEMKRLYIEIGEDNKMRWPNSGPLPIDDHRVFYTGSDDNNYFNGIGIIVNNQIKKTV